MQLIRNMCRKCCVMVIRKVNITYIIFIFYYDYYFILTAFLNIINFRVLYRRMYEIINFNNFNI